MQSLCRPRDCQLAWLLALAAVAAAAPSARADEGILVSGSGEALVKPNLLELYLTVSGEAELGADAVVKYQQAVTRTLEAFEGLKLQNLKLEPRGLAVSTTGVSPATAARMGMEPGQAPNPQVVLSRSMRLQVGGIDGYSDEELIKLVSKLIDTSRDMGIVVGATENAAAMEEFSGQQNSQPVVQFVADNVQKPREQACRQAFERAKERAQRLAALSGVKLGEVKSIEELHDSAAADDAQEVYLAAVYPGVGQVRRGDKAVASTRFQEIPVAVTLKVRFAIAPGAK